MGLKTSVGLSFRFLPFWSLCWGKAKLLLITQLAVPLATALLVLLTHVLYAASSTEALTFLFQWLFFPKTRPLESLLLRL